MTHIKRILEIKVIMPIEVPSNEFVNLRLRGSVQILELVHGLELDHVQTVREYAIGLTLEQVFRFIGRDV